LFFLPQICVTARIPLPAKSELPCPHFSAGERQPNYSVVGYTQESRFDRHPFIFCSSPCLSASLVHKVRFCLFFLNLRDIQRDFCLGQIASGEAPERVGVPVKDHQGTSRLASEYEPKGDPRSRQIAELTRGVHAETTSGTAWGVDARAEPNTCPKV